MSALKSIEARSTTLDALLSEVEGHDVIVQVLRDGKAIAEVRPIAAPARRPLPPVDPRLKPILSPDYDPVAGIDEEDWPDDQR